ncbi:MAG: hypothetical protein KAX49_07350 [Halanaerobiales bacterium]|nr:hypothetical protein [Halanaerobiales bacterium]
MDKIKKSIKILREYVEKMPYRDGNEDLWQELADIAKEWQAKKYSMVIGDMSEAFMMGNVYENEEGSFRKSYEECMKYYKKISDSKEGHTILIEYGKKEGK